MGKPLKPASKRYGCFKLLQLAPSDNPQSKSLGLQFIECFVIQSFGLMIVRMSRRANREAEVGPAAFAIAVIIGLLYAPIRTRPRNNDSHST